MVSNGTDNMVMPVAPMYGGYNGCNGNGFGWGGDWAWIILLLLLGGNGWGNGFGGGYGADGVMPYLWNTQTQNDVNRGFDNSGLSSQLSGIQSAITSGFANAEVARCNGVIDSMNQRFTDTQFIGQNINTLSAQLAQCCADNRLATANLGATIASEACDTRTTDTQNTQLLLNAINGGIQSIKDQICNDKIDSKNEKIADLERQLTAAQSNAFVQKGLADEVDALYNRLSNCPVPSTPVYGRTPIFTCNNGCGCGA